MPPITVPSRPVGQSACSDVPYEEERMVLDMLGAIAGGADHAAVFAAVPLGPAQDAEDGFEAPNPPPTEIPGLGSVSNMFIGWLKWVLIVGGVTGLLIVAIMMTVGRRGRSALAAEYAGGIPWVLGGLALGSIAATIVGTVMK